MGSDFSPAIPRRELLIALRKLRELRGLTEDEVAAQLCCPVSKVQDIERGDTPVRADDLLALLRLYGVSDRETIAQLVELADVAAREGWWSEADYREHLTDAMLSLQDRETEAERIFVSQPSLIPGFLQNRGYAEAVLDKWEDFEVSYRARKIRLEARMRRKQHLFGHEDAPEIRVVLGEGVMQHEPACVRVMAAQLAYLLHMLRTQPNLHIRILRNADAGQDWAVGPFTLLDLGSDGHTLLYLENHLTDEFVMAPDRTDAYAERFGRLWECALTEQDSRDLVRWRAQKLGYRRLSQER